MAISLFPDYTQLVQEACRKFVDAKAALQKYGLRYLMLYPTRLRVKMDCKQFIFNTPADALAFCKVHKFQPPTPEENIADLLLGAPIYRNSGR
ncbi:hypothetical protein NDU88_002924 [Pleurodeles waltl]|uniref:Uncharacterized protein n=1 Tax=Pleurodeles waltl TaxID=8319 RepID=A0AAV7TM13_PLEWA|nr:hypothetical protein NDU88_002924 [Pleurodeles waltl]